MGFKILRTYLFTTSKGEENVQYVDKVRDNIFFCLRHNYGVSNAYLEDIFLSNKYYYQEDEGFVELIHQDNLAFEVKYWNQDWIRKSNSFQQFAKRLKEIRDAKL